MRIQAAEMRFAIQPRPGVRPRVVLDVPHDVGLDFFEWLGLERPEFGVISPRELAPLCRRRLWPLPRNDHPTFQPMAAAVLAIAESAIAAGNTSVLFG